VRRARGPICARARDHLWPLLEEALLAPSVRGLRELVQALAIARQIERRGGRRSHARALRERAPGTVARIVSPPDGVPYSFTAHATDIYLSDAWTPMRFRRLVHDAAFVTTVCEANKSYIELKLLEHAEPKLRRLYHGIDLEAFSPDNTPKGDAAADHGVGPAGREEGLPRAAQGLRRTARSAAAVQLHRDRRRPGARAPVRELDPAQARGPGRAARRASPRRGARRCCGAPPWCACPASPRPAATATRCPPRCSKRSRPGRAGRLHAVGGVPEILGEGEGGLLVPENNAFSLAAALRSRAGNSHRDREARRAQGRQRAERLFDLRRNVAELHTLIKHGRPATARPSTSSRRRRGPRRTSRDRARSRSSSSSPGTIRATLVAEREAPAIHLRD
jgi:hypothetical protein